MLDIGTQGMQITNQAIIYALRPDARSRINSAYMVCYFIGGAVGSVTAGVVYSARGWSGVCLLGAVFGLLTCALTAYERVRPPASGARPARARTAEASARGDPVRSPRLRSGERLSPGPARCATAPAAPWGSGRERGRKPGCGVAQASRAR